jgi:FkbH-like protein
MKLKWLNYLPINENLAELFTKLRDIDSDLLWGELVNIAQANVEFTKLIQFDRFLSKALADETKQYDGIVPLRLAILGSATVNHLLPGIKLACTRRRLPIITYYHDYGLALQKLTDPSSDLHAFKPDIVLISWTAAQLLGSKGLTLQSEDTEKLQESALAELRTVRHFARTAFNCSIIQQTLLPTAQPLIGSNEHNLFGSPKRIIAKINEKLRQEAIEEKFDILAIDDYAAESGIDAWYDPGLWHKAKQEISPLATPFYGELVARIIAAQRGRSYKCLVLDLDNTLWGGVIGDDGLEGIKLGQGSSIGEAYLAFQRYIKDLSRRGVILAVCSKNDEKNALLPFENHPEMVLKREDIACFVANWNDKASNIREIAKQINIGLDSLVFVDDNPFERNQVRSELPMVAVPELPSDPTLYLNCLASAGYFETIAITADDFSRTKQYQDNLSRAISKENAGNIDDYLLSLDMDLQYGAIDSVSITRVTQLINKTNQFNLTTRRFSIEEVQEFADNPLVITLHMRLIDRYGDNGIIAIIIAEPEPESEHVLRINSWLMSCRVLGRGVENAALALLVEQAKTLGIKTLIGEYIPTEKNAMVADHYSKLGFTQVESQLDDGHTLWALDIDSFVANKFYINLTKV